MSRILISIQDGGGGDGDWGGSGTGWWVCALWLEEMQLMWSGYIMIFYREIILNAFATANYTWSIPCYT